MPEGRDIWKRSLRVTVWVLLGIGALSLLVAAMNIGSTRRCAGVSIAYAAGGSGTYVRPDDALRWMGFTSPSSPKGMPLKDLDLRSLERRLEKEPWVREAELYVDRNRILHVLLQERVPVARLFTTEGVSFFIDSSMGVIPLNVSHTPRVTVFTGLPVSARARARRDSLILSEVRDLAFAIASDSLMAAQVEQVDLDPVKGFVAVPKVGEHAIIVGDGSDLQDKFRRLKVFYGQVLSQTGWSTYREVDLRFRGQVVAMPTRRQTVASTETVNKAASAAKPTSTAPVEAAVEPAATTDKPKGKQGAAGGKAAGAGKPKAVMPAKKGR